MSQKKLDGLNNQINPDNKYYVQDNRQYVGNCVLWWGTNHNGYTCEIDKAGKYKGDEVLSMRDTDIPWPVDYVETKTIRHVRAEHLGKP